MRSHVQTLVVVLAALGLLALLRPATLAVPAGPDDDATALTKLDDDWSAAAATRDADKVASFYAEDANAYPPNEPLAKGRAAARKVWAAYLADASFKISWKTTHAEVAKSGDIGYTVGTYEDSFNGADGMKVSEKGKYLCVWKKQKDGSWKAIQDMWNADSK